MKKNAFSFWSIAAIVVGYIALIRLITSADPDRLSGISLPAGFPTRTGLIVIWGILFLLWSIGCVFVYSVRLSPRRKRNIFLNSIILAAGIYIWHFLVFGACNLPGALAVSIAILLLAVVVWFMYLVTHRYGGYLFTPSVVWLVFVLYLSISLAVRN